MNSLPVPVELQPHFASGKPPGGSKIHEGALRMLASLTSAIAKTKPSLLVSALRTVADSLGTTEPLSLFPELGQTWLPASEAVPEAMMKVTATSFKSKTSAPAMALASSSAEWVSSKSKSDTSSLVIAFTAPVHVSAVHLKCPKKSNTPGTIELFAEHAKTGSMVRLWGPVAGSMFAESRVVHLGTGAVTSKLIIRCKGYSAKNKDSRRSHSLAALSVGRFSTPPPPASVQLRSVIESISRTLGEMASGLDVPEELADASLLALSRVFIASGSAFAGVTMLRALSVRPSMSALALQSARQVVSVLRAQSIRACRMVNGSAGSSGLGGGLQVVSGAAFSTKHHYARVKGGGSSLYSESSDTWGQVNQPMTSGRYQWEIQLIEDSNGGECSCMGVGIEKPKDTGYDSQSSFALVRCFNGRLYNFGKTEDKQIEKIHPKDKVRFDLDMDRGTLRMAVNGKDQGVCFKGLNKHKKLFPTVQFYSSGREAKLLWFKGGGGSGDGDGSTPLATMTPAKRSKTALPLGTLDRTGDHSAAITLNGGSVISTSGLSITLKGSGNGAGGPSVPSSVYGAGVEAATQVTYDIAAVGADYFTATLGICDPPVKSSKDKPANKAAASAAAAAASRAPAAAPEAEDLTDALDESKTDAPEMDAAETKAAEPPVPPKAAAASAGSVLDGPTITLQVIGDSTVLFTSRPFTVTKEAADMPYGHPSLAPEGCRVGVAGYKKLTLVVKSDAPVAEGVHAVFADACLAKAPWMARTIARLGQAANRVRSAAGDELEGASTGLAAASRISAALGPILDEGIGSSTGTRLRPLPWDGAGALTLPFVADPTAATIETTTALVGELHERAKASAAGAASGSGARSDDDVAQSLLLDVLSSLSLQLRRIGHCAVHPMAVGFKGVPLPAGTTLPASELGLPSKGEATPDSPDAAAAASSGAGEAALVSDAAAAAVPSAAAAIAPSDEAAAETTMSRLREEMVAMSEDGALPMRVRAAASAVIDDNISLFYPTAALRAALLSNITRGGTQGVVEVQIKWPVRDTRSVKAAGDGEGDDEDESGSATSSGSVTPGIGLTDSRFERLGLLIHSTAASLGLKAKLVSLWRRSIHVLLAPSSGAAAGATSGPLMRFLLEGGLSKVMQRSGIEGWNFPEGSPREGMTCSIERMLDFDRRARMAKEPGACVVRLFPASVAGTGALSVVADSIGLFLESEAQAATAEEQAAAAPASGEEEAAAADGAEDAGGAAEGEEDADGDADDDEGEADGSGDEDTADEAEEEDEDTSDEESGSSSDSSE